MAVLTGIALKADHSFESQVRCAGALPRIPETRFSTVVRLGRAASQLHGFMHTPPTVLLGP